MNDADRQGNLGANPQPEIADGNENTLGLTYGPAADLMPGQIVAQKYKVLGELGRGGMGVVYRVEQLALGRILAMKTLNTHEVTDVAWRRFQVEAKAAALLDHPNLITVHDCGLINNEIPFFIMDYIEGTTLSKLIKDRGALSLEEALTIFIQVCFGLAYAHAVGVIHRDLKPSNIMLVPPQTDSSGLSVRVVDFGIAKLTAEEIQPTQALTRTGEIFGSPLYMSPEQCLGKPVDFRSDIYSLGCVMFETLTGLPPFLGNTALSTMMQHQSNEAPSLKEATLGKEFPQAIEKIVRLMLEKNPDARYQDMKSVARDLSLLQQGISHHPPTMTETKSETIARTNKLPSIKLLYACLLSAALAGAVVYYAMSQQIAAAYRAGFESAQSPARTIYIPKEGAENAVGGPISTIAPGPDGKPCRTFNFGEEKGFGMGFIYLLDKDKTIPAKGTLTFPLEEPLRFDVEDKIIVTNPNFLLRFNSNEFTGLRFRFNFGVSDSTFKYLDRQQNLKILDITGCDVSAQLIDTLNRLPKLEALRVSKTNITGPDLLKLKRLNQLKVLNIAKLPGQADVLKKLKGSSTLKELRISADKLTLQDLHIISTFKNLDHLWIEKAGKLSDKDLDWISDLHMLQEFCPLDSSLTYKLVNAVRKMPNLKLLAVNHKLWSKADVASFQKEFPKIELAIDNRATE